MEKKYYLYAKEFVSAFGEIISSYKQAGYPVDTPQDLRNTLKEHRDFMTNEETKVVDSVMILENNIDSIDAKILIVPQPREYITLKWGNV